jgi:maleate isomerase
MVSEFEGWRARVGLILNSGQIVTEPLYYRVAPAGVNFYASRILVERGVLENHADMEREAFRAGRELATARVGCIAYCCTMSGILQGIEGNKEFCIRMEKETGIPTTSTLSAILEGLKTLNLNRIVLISPYQEEMHTIEERFFQANGFHLVKSRSMKIEKGKVPLVTPGEIYRFCRENWDEEADGLLISCMNFNAMPCIGHLEEDLGRPVLSSHSATLWKVLRMIRVHEPIPGFGHLLAEDFKRQSKKE